MGFTQDLLTSRRNIADGSSRIGELDRLWYSSDDNTIRIGDGVTPGGIIVTGGGGGGTYVLPTASTTVKGGVKIDGTTIKILNEVISGFDGNYNSLTNKPVIFSGSYNDLTDKPTIPAAQVNSDWNAVSGVAAILNKPVIFSGSYNDLTDKPSIPAAQVNSDWNATSGVAEILNKPNIGAITEVFAATSEPMGHEDFTKSAISFSDASRTFTITPVNGSYNIWVKGTKIVISTSKSVTIPNTNGLYYIYFDSTGTLQYKTAFYDWPNDCMTAYVYWNALTQKAPFVADERHGITLDWQTHEYLHRTRGAAIANGFSASNYIVNADGSLDSHLQLDISSGTFFDEDLQVDVVSTNTPLPNTWQQDLTGPSRIPMFYINSGGGWVMDAATNFPVKQGLLPKYNLYSGGVWTTPDIDNNKFGLTFILATNNINYPVIGIIGQTAHDNQGDSEAINFTDLSLPGFPIVEFRLLYKLVYQCKTSYTNAVHARLVSIFDLRSFSSTTSAIATYTDHGSLGGLLDNDHPQYLLRTDLPTTNTGTATKLQTARNINGVAFDGSADITVTAAANTLTGTALNSSVVSSGLTSVGTLTSLQIQSVTSGANSLKVAGSGTGDQFTVFTSGTAGAGIVNSVQNTTLTGYAPLVTNASAMTFKTGATSGTAVTALSINNSGQLTIPNTTTHSGQLSVTNAGNGTSYNDANNAMNVAGTLGVGTNLYVGNNISIANGMAYYINNVNVLNATTLGSIITNSSLTSVGTLSSLALGGSLTTTQTTQNVFNSTATTVNFAGAATTLSIGSSSGTTTVNNALTATGSITGNATAAFVAGTNSISNVALQMSHESAIRNVYNGASNMYFDVSNGGSTHGTFQFRSSNAFTNFLTMNTSGAQFNTNYPIKGQTPYVARTSWNVGIDTELTVDDFRFRISNQGGIFPQVISNTAGTKNSAWTAIGALNGTSVNQAGSTGVILPNNSWTTMYNLHGMDAAGDTITTTFQDKAQGRIYRITFMRSDNGSTTGYNIIAERLL